MKGVSPDHIPPIWNYTFPFDKLKLNDNLIEYIRKITDYIFLPCYIYKPITPDEFNRISIVILDNYTNHELYNNPNKYINKNLVKDAFEEVIPESTWEIDIILKYMEGYEDFVLDINEILTKERYNQIKTTFGIPDKSIIIIIAAGEYGRPGGYALLNQIVQIIGSYGRPKPGDYTYCSYLIIHEVGHTIGLFHPHDYVTLNEKDSSIIDDTDWLFDFISTPMTYAHYDVSFSTFDRESIARGHTARYINKSWNLLYEANKTLLNKNISSVNGTLESILNYISKNKSLCYSAFESRDFFEAHYYAKQYYLLAQTYYDLIVEKPTSPPSKPSISGYEIEIITLTIGISIVGLVTSIKKRWNK